MKPTLEALHAFLQPIRAYLAQDGGDIDFVRVSDDGRILYVRLKGTCQTCDLNSTTLQAGRFRTPAPILPIPGGY